MNQTTKLEPGESYGLGNAGWPPATVCRREDGTYYLGRLGRPDRELTEEEAEAWIASDQD